MSDRPINQASGRGSKATLTATAKLRSVFRMLRRTINTRTHLFSDDILPAKQIQPITHQGMDWQ